ncbi:hypothetical protein T265_06318 [Opisthorchis viverrini]|uniref:Uncharacterized protein n=1 Tax=Opisthorchis viverrini TaxID=6198 RepID=A0A074ZGQ8_OPIVI|nr:hypothetical protein T265_06318 [Opisthorchis viverrini]KER26466.1 hypothetical protein T265_06318 [Opisthorchis viverrini]
MCCTRPPHVSVDTVFEISRYMYRRNTLLIRLLKTLRQPTTGFCLIYQLYFNQSECGVSFELTFAGDSPGTQLKMCCTRPPHVSVDTVFEISRYMYRRSTLLIRLLKTLRQPTTGFCLIYQLYFNQSECGCLTAMLPEGNTRAKILSGCPSLDRRSREAEVGFDRALTTWAISPPPLPNRQHTLDKVQTHTLLVHLCQRE